MRVLIVGATGVLGRHVAPRLLERGHSVRTVARPPQQIAKLQQLGAEAVRGDILDAVSMNKQEVENETRQRNGLGTGSS